MDKSLLTANLHAPVSRLEMIKNYCRGKSVLDIGCVQHNACNSESFGWLHQVIADVATSVLGVDYLEEDIKKLNAQGFNMIAADITKPLDLIQRFDVIVVGNLIEHLSSFEGLLLNIRRLLKPGGCALISTANPFYRDQYFYAAFKNDIVVNPEHTCWIDPITLDQLCRRFDLATCDVYWVKEKWRLGQVILNGKGRTYDMFTGRWIFSSPSSFIESTSSVLLWNVFKCFYPSSVTSRILKKHGEETRRLVFMKFVEMVFEVFWSVYRLLIVTAPINKYELFVSVLRADLADRHACDGASGRQVEEKG